MSSQTRKQIIIIHKFPNISRSNGNQTMKFGQLIKYNVRNIFLERLYAKCNIEKQFQDLFSKINSLKFYTDCFRCMPS